MQLQVTLQFESFEEMMDTLGRLEADRVQEIAPAAIAPAAQPESDSDEIDAAPAAIKLAEELGVGIYDVQGTGKGGRILKRDVQAHYDAGQAAPTEYEKAAEAGARAEQAELPAEGEMTLEQLRAKFRALSQHEAQGPAAVLEVLEQFGVSTLSKLSPDFYPRAAAIIDKRLAG